MCVCVRVWIFVGEFVRMKEELPEKISINGDSAGQEVRILHVRA